MLIEAVAGAVVIVAVCAFAGARRTRRKADSIRRFSKAVSALRSIADEPRLIDKTLYGARLSPLAGHLEFLRDTLPMRLLADAAMKSAAVRRFFHARSRVSYSSGETGGKGCFCGAISRRPAGGRNSRRW